MDRWMDGWMGGQMDGQTEGWMGRQRGRGAPLSASAAPSPPQKRGELGRAKQTLGENTNTSRAAQTLSEPHKH
eukprot:3162-Chlamydomonas_euryale.AAC.1